MAATFTVTTTADSGPGSLREAITLANAAPGEDQISFGIGTGSQIIQLTSALPAITDALIIAGETQPGFIPGNPPLITVRGMGAGSFEAFTLQAPTYIRSLQLIEFSQAIIGASDDNFIESNEIVLTSSLPAVELSGSSNLIWKNRIGGGTALALAGQDAIVAGNRIGGTVYGVTVSGTGHHIGSTVWGGNIIGASNGNAALIDGSGNFVEGNEITGGAFGTLMLQGTGHTVGGTTAAARNVINGDPAIQLNGSDHIILGNYINLTPAGAASGSGIAIRTNSGPGGHTIGTTFGGRNYIRGMILISSPGNLFEDNVLGGDVAENPSNSAILLDGAASGNVFLDNIILAQLEIFSGTGNLVRGNTFRPPSEGVELEPFMPNDPGDADTGPNNRQNSPVLTHALNSPLGAEIFGTLSSTPSTMFTLEFFNGSVCGESVPIGTTIVMTDASGNASFSFPASAMQTSILTATATDPGNNTSPMAPCISTTAAAVVSVSADLTVNESVGFIPLTVTLSRPLTEPAAMGYSAFGGTATYGQDFEQQGTTVVFAPGETTKTVDVMVIQDFSDEDDETFFVTLSQLSNNYTIGDGSAQVTIADDDDLFLTALDARIAEGESGAEATVTLSLPTNATVTVDYVIEGGTATEGVDFVAASGTLTFEPGELTKTIPVTTLTDRLAEPNETIFVTLSNASHGTIAQATGVVTLIDVPPGGKRRAARK
jgi:Calx-beta domain